MPPLSFLRDSPVPDPSPERLAALYAFTRAQATSNPDGYASNVAWWGQVLAAGLQEGTLGDADGSGSAASSRAGSAFKPDLASASSKGPRDTLVLTVDDGLLSRVTQDGRRPKGLGGVVESLASERSLMRLAAYNALTSGVEQGPGLARRALGAGLGLIGGLVWGKGAPAPEETCWKTAQGRWVHVGNVKVSSRPTYEAAATSFAAHLAANPPLHHSDCLFSRATFLETFATTAPEAPLTKRDVDVLLLYLQRDVGSVQIDGDVASPLGLGEGPITEADRGTLSVKSTLAAVEAQIEDIESQSAKTMDKVRSSLKAGQKAGAAAYLKSKKGLDDVLSKRIATGEQLRSVLRSIDDAKSNAEIMSAYELSTSSLASALADPRLSPDRIANTTDALADVLADSKEISDAIEIGGAQARQAAGAPEFDEDELAAELDVLVLEEKTAQKERAEREAREAVARKEAEGKAAAARKVAEEKQKVEEKEKKEREERERAARVAAAQQAIKSSEKVAEKTEGSKMTEEKERAERERLEKESQRLPAE
ncbi:hypothetical protein A1Q1_00446 [Trichosporon asahii var. asahii CBS 2479]|uniref:Uncharacterized protein n=1 Tax=Trichosporon asahii var. asahii (strain ATCC 90039 / CBS 2479 / JCM 2466 / KCTC 7840 / NBRC 103889/ NCYC 2677 / UAMH 7654) TaxID=1186058 RepID=J5R1W4_TRIAS|nr:hypothetical protein A1Q1_00446 [Trichosporon asahii var. asahii CBS 2479]EJT50288.1 hypothetical protein A1Q1_00446 [Trichosporon asahii var. asahii CBS 2479]